MERKILETDETRKKPVYGVGISDDLRSMTVTQVLARPGRSCQVCRVDETGERGAYVLHIHYIDGDPTNTRFNNLKLLCEGCHKQADLDLSRRIGTLQDGTLQKGTPPQGSKRTPRQAQKIENVTDKLIRLRIEKIKPMNVQMCCKYVYLIDGRVSQRR